MLNIQTINGGISRSTNLIAGVTSGAAVPNIDYIYIWSGSTPYAYTQPTAVGNNNLYTIKNGSTVNQTISFTGGQTGDGSASLVLTPNTSLDLISDGTNWRIQ